MTRTGWTLGYVDDLSLDRALELLEFWQRGTAPTTARPWMPVDENAALSQFSSLQVMMPGVARMPEEMRRMIDWAEEQKAKRGMN